MDGSIFNAIDKVVAAAGSTNGHDIAAYLHIEEVTPAGPYVGYSMRIGFYTTISVHEDLNARANLLITDHEVMHVVNNDFEDFAGGGGIFDQQAFTPGDDKRLITVEMIANIGGADLFIPTESLLEEIGYNNPSLQAFRDCDTEKRDHIRRYQDAIDRWRFCQSASERDRVRGILMKEQRALKLLDEARQDYASEIEAMHCCFTLEQLAKIYRVSPEIIRYKMRALQLRGYEVDPQELESFDKLFRHRG